MKIPIGRKIIKVISILCLAMMVGLGIYCYRRGLFSSVDNLQEYIAGLGARGPIVFIALQVAQVVMPVLPAAVGYLAGAVLFGPWMGFLYSYIGICVGSMLAFVIARLFGMPLIQNIFDESLLQKYENWTSQKRHFSKLLAIAILLPLVPDDFLCYLAGTTRMSFYEFAMIILIFKPFAIAFYNFGVNRIFG